MRHFLKASGILSAIVLAVCLYAYAYENIRIVRLDNIFDPRRGYPATLRDEYFSKDFPSAKDIGNYLSDSTILNSEILTGNEVFYFDGNNRFVSWRRDSIESGKWWSFSRLQIILYKNDWRAAIVQVFCMSFHNVPKEAQQDNCYDVEAVDALLARGRGTWREHRKGNVFALFRNKPAPFRLPDSKISIDSLLSMKSTTGGN